MDRSTSISTMKIVFFLLLSISILGWQKASCTTCFQMFNFFFSAHAPDFPELIKLTLGSQEIVMCGNKKVCKEVCSLDSSMSFL